MAASAWWPTPALAAALGGVVGMILPAAPAASACLVLAALGFCVQALLIVAPAVRQMQSLPARP